MIHREDRCLHSFSIISIDIKLSRYLCQVSFVCKNQVFLISVIQNRFWLECEHALDTCFNFSMFDRNLFLYCVMQDQIGNPRCKIQKKLQDVYYLVAQLKQLYQDVYLEISATPLVSHNRSHNDVWTKVVQGLWSHSLEWSARLKDSSLSKNSFRKLLKTFLFDRWPLLLRICGIY